MLHQTRDVVPKLRQRPLSGAQTFEGVRAQGRRRDVQWAKREEVDEATARFQVSVGGGILAESSSYRGTGKDSPQLGHQLGAVISHRACSDGSSINLQVFPRCFG